MLYETGRNPDAPETTVVEWMVLLPPVVKLSVFQPCPTTPLLQFLKSSSLLGALFAQRELPPTNLKSRLYRLVGHLAFLLGIVQRLCSLC